MKQQLEAQEEELTQKMEAQEEAFKEQLAGQIGQRLDFLHELAVKRGHAMSKASRKRVVERAKILNGRKKMKTIVSLVQRRCNNALDVARRMQNDACRIKYFETILRAMVRDVEQEEQ